jgi:hypothetical protein
MIGYLNSIHTYNIIEIPSQVELPRQEAGRVLEGSHLRAVPVLGRRLQLVLDADAVVLLLGEGEELVVGQFVVAHLDEGEVDHLGGGEEFLGNTGPLLAAHGRVLFLLGGRREGTFWFDQLRLDILLGEVLAISLIALGLASDEYEQVAA